MTHGEIMTKQEDWKIVEVSGKTFIPFAWIDKTPGGSNLGHAEFCVCLRFKRGRVSEFWVYPAQQRDTNTAWHYTGGDIDFSISSYEHLTDAKVWLYFWCKDHKCPSMRIYVPRYSKFLEIDYHGISFWSTNPYGEAKEGRMVKQ